jgi:EAL domain-containing protein (putative c-di-GMP-specific phosphodiesterase class I)
LASCGFQGFVRDITTDPNDAAIVQTIIAMTEALGLNVIAEGVETREQKEFLEPRGCHAFQGYFFGRPMPLAQFEAGVCP